MSDRPQSAASHAKMVAPYHYFVLPVSLASIVYFGYRTVTEFSVDMLMFFLFVLAMAASALFARVFPLGAQDRVIRLEERLRMERLLSDELRPRIDEVSTEHLIGLRFASDGELEELVGRVLSGELADRKAVKQAIKSWRPDHQRL